MVLPDALEYALEDIEDPFMPHAGSPVDLPLPGLRVKGLPDPVALPLPPAQAEKLAALARVCPHGKGLETVVDTSVRDCLEIDPDAISFTNSKFRDAIDNVAKTAVASLGVNVCNVGWTLYKMLLYKTGGHFKPHRDTEKTKGMFATLTVQLPSCFKGGELVVRHKGEEEIYTCGANDGTNEFGSFYTAFFADLEHEILPVKEGYRLALVYSLSWTGQGDPPTADENEMAHVVRALKEYAGESPCGAWKLAFGLSHQYTQCSIENLGTNALKGTDRRNVGALVLAAELAGMGQLEVLICKLTRTDEERGNGWYSRYGEGSFDVDETEEGEVSLETAYSADGSEYSGKLDFIDWDDIVGSDVDFELEEEGAVEYTGNEGATRETTYGAMTVLMWPKDKDIEVRFTDSSNVHSLFAVGPPESFAVRAERLLSCFEERRGLDAHAWNQANELLELTIHHNLMQLAPRAIKVISNIRNTPGVEMVLRDCVSKLGWASVGDAIEKYICPTDTDAVHCVDGRIRTIDRLRDVIPFEVSCQGLEAVLKILESKWSVILSKDTGMDAMPWHYHARSSDTGDSTRFAMWRSLVDTISMFESKASGEEGKAFDAEVFVSRLVSLFNKLDESQIAPVKKALSYVITGPGLKQSERLRSAVGDRFYVLKSDRFMKEAKLAIEKGTARSPADMIRNERMYHYPYSMYRSPATDWEPFLALAADVMNRELVPDEVTKQFHNFVCALPSFSKVDIDIVLSLVMTLEKDSKASTAISQVKEAATRARDVEKVKSLRGEIHMLENATRVEPRNVGIKYSGISVPGYPRIGSFMAGNGVEERITGFNSVVTARKVLQSFQHRLPNGTVAYAGGTGQRSFISIKKPFAAQRRERVEYEDKIRRLKEARTIVAIIEAQLRRPVDGGEDHPAQKVAKVQSGPGDGVGGREDDGVMIVAENIIPKNVNEPQIIVVE